jgi:hypothetical protein
MGVQLIAVSPEPPEVIKQYLSEHNLGAYRPVSYTGSLTPTPTLLLVDSQGTIKDVRVGQQTPNAEQETLDNLQSLGAGL